MTTPEEAVRKYLKGIGAIPKEDPPQAAPVFEVLREIELKRKMETILRPAVRKFQTYLEIKGFITRVYEYSPNSIIVDFHDPDLEVELMEVAGRLNHLKGERYASIQTRGSIEFSIYNDEYVVRGDIPVSMLRPIHPSEEFWRETIKEEKPADITEVHLHMWDHKPAVHIHVEGKNVDPTKLAHFITRIRDISKRFLTERR